MTDEASTGELEIISVRRCISCRRSFSSHSRKTSENISRINLSGLLINTIAVASRVTDLIVLKI